MDSNLSNKVVTASKWSSVTEIAAKLVTPVSTMILARLLAPDAFGVLVTATIVISFAEIFSDAGFQNYLIYYNFDSREDQDRTTSVAFWSNTTIGLVIWILCIIFSAQIANIVGNTGYGEVIAVACVCIPLTSSYAVPMALFKKELDFKTLFYIRMVGVLVPLFITIPLAYFTRSYWSLIIGMIALNMINAVLIFYKSLWRPSFYYSMRKLKNMLSYCSWSLIESILTWCSSYIDLFIIAKVLNDAYLGIYRVSINTVGQILGLITATFIPIIFSSLAKLQTDNEKFKSALYKFQKILGMFLIPLGFAIFVFRDQITYILLGSQWMQGAFLLGLWGFTNSFVIIFAHLASCVYRAIGKPKLAAITQLVNVIFIVPTVLISIQVSFDCLCISRAFIRFTGVIMSFILLYRVVNVSPKKLLSNVLPEFSISLIVSIVAMGLLYLTNNFILQIVYMGVSICLYFIITYLIPKERKILYQIKSYIKPL